ncbi:hypothetical protein AJ79_09296 [Helicocarpus griseus UAMH5409]|uniref:Uncharacterized protein n=1 Tax=Helicocarpus griseus UAMH5409 TaxID=1447875 RepID=A0A2B7WCL0_9EURO|nr:hypothetical protein AJ79_09296 [Helicocarpus griseus UAMH5409]
MFLLHLPVELVLIVASNIESDADLNAFARASRALPWAVLRDRESTAQKSLEAGAGPNSALIIATKLRSVRVIKLPLGQKGVDPNVTDSYGNTPLILAAQDCLMEILELLLAQDDIEPNFEGPKGRTALAHAVVCRRTAAVERLLDFPTACVNSKDFRGRAPLHYAVRSLQVDVVKLLLSKRADPNIMDADSMTPLAVCIHHLLTGYKCHRLQTELILRLLISHPETTIKYIQSYPIVKIFEWCLNDGDKEIFKLLLAKTFLKDVDIDFIREYNITLFVWAVNYVENEDITAMILRGGYL